MSQHITELLNEAESSNSTQLLGNLQSVGPNTQSSVVMQSDAVDSDKHQQQVQEQNHQEKSQQQNRIIGTKMDNGSTTEYIESVRRPVTSTKGTETEVRSATEYTETTKLLSSAPITKPQQQQQQQQQQQVQSQTMSSIHPSVHTKNQLSTNNDAIQFLTKSRLQDLVKEVDPTEQLDDEVEEMLLQLADDFVETTVNAACLLAKHRHANTVEVKDVQLHLERNWNMWIPGFGTDEVRPYKRATVTEAHKQRLALIRKSVKKY